SEPDRSGNARLNSGRCCVSRRANHELTHLLGAARGLNRGRCCVEESQVAWTHRPRATFGLDIGMVFEGISGQPTAIQTLRQALARGRVHQAYRFEGTNGVGNERAALALAQSLLGTESGETGEGCGACSACRRVVVFSELPPHVPKHPDVLVVARGLYPSEV